MRTSGESRARIAFKRLPDVDPADLITLMNDPRVRRHMPLARGIQLPSAVLDAYVGQYGTEGETGRRTVTRDGERLLLSSLTGARPLPFRALTEATFGLENGQMYLVFGRDATGQVSYLDVLQREQASRLARLPMR